MTNLFDLTGRVAIVTGGNSGIGLGIAKGLASAGATLAIIGRSKPKMAAALAELGASAAGFETDITDRRAVFETVALIEKQFGRIDILVNNAGTNMRKRPEAFSELEWSSIIDTNLKAAFMCSQAVHPAMQRAGGGKIIMIGSLAAIFGNTMSPVYAASKGGLVQLAKSLAVAWAADNIQVNTINPGYISTDLVKVGLQQAPETFAQVLPRTPAGRWGEPDDFAGIAIFLSSRASDFVTGTAIAVDGGYSVRY